MHKRGGPWNKYLFEEEPNLLQHALPRLTAVLDYLKNNGIQILNVSNKTGTLEQTALHVTATSNIAPPDAFIISSALVLGFDTFASMDGRWKDLHSGTLYYHK